MPVRHRFVSPVTDNGSATLVGPSGWNEAHLAPPFIIPIIHTTTWTNMPLAATEFTGGPRNRADLTQVDSIRLVLSMSVVGAAASFLQAHYASGTQANWANLTDPVPCSGLNVWHSAWTAIPPGAKTDAFIRIMGSGGDGALDPQFRLVQIQVR